MRLFKILSVLICLLGAANAHAEKILVAAAADLKFAMDDVVSEFRKANPDAQVDVAYGSSGKFFAQLQQAAPFDIFFSADISLPQELQKMGLTASEVKPYAIGRIVLWSSTMDATKMNLSSLTDPKITRIAIANPKHAPYGKRAEEALKSSGIWDKVESKFVYGENIAQTAQYVQTANAQVGIIALSLAKNPELANRGGYWLIPDNLHQPLEQGYVVMKRAEGSELARRFSTYIASKPARTIFIRYGFVLPGDK